MYNIIIYILIYIYYILYYTLLYIKSTYVRCDYSNVKVTFYLNEKPLILKGCKNGVCDWAKLKKKLGAIIANCKVEVCQKES